MQTINKSTSEPPELLQYRKSGSNVYWDGFAQKDVLRHQLAADQGYLCCYCMRRVNQETLKIEHYRPRSIFPNEQLSWKNLLAACDGGEGQPNDNQTCDTRKGGQLLTIDPQNSHDIEQLCYLADGRIASRTKHQFESDLNQVLNLNSDRLKQLRQQAFDGFLAHLGKRLGTKQSWSATKLKKELARIETVEKPPEFVGMMAF